MAHLDAHLVLAHGFTQTARSWRIIEPLLADRLPDATIDAVDLPGHGSADAVRGDLWAAADHLVGHGGPGVYVGYSMGGRIALHAALARPDLVAALVLIGATPGIVDDEERAERRRSDEALADRIEADGVPAFIDAWLRNPLFAGLSEEAAMVEDRLRNTAAGLASSLRLDGTGTQEPLWEQLSELGCPVLLVVGEHDAKFRAIAERMAERLPDAVVAVIEGAGHSAHLEEPVRTADAIAEWLDRSAIRRG